jgi:dihydroorotase
MRIIDEHTDIKGTVIIEDASIREVIAAGGKVRFTGKASCVIDGKGALLMPSFIDLHAHFRSPGFPEKETLESASLAAVAGGYGTLVCMANTKPVIDTIEAVSSLKTRSDALGLIDLYPAMALTRGMEGKELSDIKRLTLSNSSTVRLFSEDGKDVYDDRLFRDALNEARRLKRPVSCHCDAGGTEAEMAKQAGLPKEVWSRIEEAVATERALKLGAEAGCQMHLAHVSTQEAIRLLAEAKTRSGLISGEATPHHLALTDAARLGKTSFGAVNPILRAEEDRQALIEALKNGVIDAIATDHAPHTQADKAAGAPGFTGLETSFAVCHTFLVKTGQIDLSKLSSLMSAAPARILGLSDRGHIEAGARADLTIIDPEARWTPEPERFKSRGKNSPFAGLPLIGMVTMTLHKGVIVMMR